ncbi:MAG: ABC transporter ATP-binding protein [Lachnospiraceae bacterium]|nr:ABC transporter ATP-binding protein [Lachnospiraceae bacterium]
MGEFAIEVNDLTKTYKLYENNKRRIIEGLFPNAKPQYKEFNALKNVSFKIKKGEIVGIIGKNGSGKSTLLKIITGVLNSTEGSVVVDGRISALLELGAGFNPEYTGIENIYLNGTLNKISREEMSKRIEDIAAFADIGDFIHQPVKNYSSGMFVRLAFAVAVYSDPDILIVDEALAVGDAAFQAKCMARMNQIMKSGATVLFVTHDMNTVKRLCQRCIYLENGTKIMEGPAEELADIYLKRIRASMNEEHLKIDEADMKPVGNNSVENDSVIEITEEKEIENKEFMEKTKMFKEGNGDVEFIDLKLLDENRNQTLSFSFEQKMTMKVRAKVHVDGVFGVAYHIRDDKNTELLGSSTLRETGQLFQGKAGEVYDIEITTPLPLIEGNYNITLVASRPVIENRTALFLAYIENAAVFSVEENTKMKLWDKFYIKNEVCVKKLC